LCESHAAEAGYLTEDPAVEPLTTPPLFAGDPAEEPSSPALADGSADLQRALENDLVAVASAPPVRAPLNHSETLLADEGVGNTAREDFEAHGTVTLSRPSPGAEQAEHSNAERLCVSGHGEECTYESTVHCPKCRKWFCDAHAEDENWHFCVRKM
jgi:hypothetical protein